jgi:hypothetical protein
MEAVRVCAQQLIEATLPSLRCFYKTGAPTLQRPTSMEAVRVCAMRLAATLPSLSCF